MHRDKIPFIDSALSFLHSNVERSYAEYESSIALLNTIPAILKPYHAFISCKVALGFGV